MKIVINKEFKSLKKLLKSIEVDSTSKKYVALSIDVKNANKNSKVTRYILEEMESTDILIGSQTIKTYSNDNVLFLVNPVSGKKKGKSIMMKIEPTLVALKLKYTAIITKSQTHMSEIDFTPFSKIVFISGDGLIFDYLQMAVTKNLLDIPIAILKAGTGNALSTSLDILDFNIALLIALYGSSRRMNLTKYNFTDKQVYSFLGFYWALIADIDLGSEGFRFVGPLRTDLAAVYYMLKHKRYDGILKYKDNDEWVTRKINVSCFLAMTLPYLDEEHYGCPWARLEDKYIHIVYKDFRLKDGLSLLLNGRDLEAFEKLKMDYIKTTEYELEPLGKPSLLDLDGEFVPFGKLTAKVTDLGVILMAPEWLNEDILTSTDSNINKENK